MWWSCSCSFAAGCRHIAPPALLPAPLAFLGRELLSYGIYFRLAARTGLVEGKKGAEKVQAVVGEVGAQVAVGVGEERVEVYPCNAFARSHSLKAGVDVADYLFFSGHFFIAAERVVYGQHGLEI